MAQDKVSLFNLALSAAGARGRVSSPTEASREAEICQLWFDPTYRQILRAAPWASARAVGRLALLNERTFSDDWIAGNPQPEYQFAYALPAGCLRPRFLFGYARFELSLLSASQQALMTGQEDAILYYTMDQPLIQQWDATLYLAVAHALGAYICLPLNGKTQQARSAQGMANSLILQAQETSANESYEPQDSVPDWIQIRGSVYNAPVSRYIYPNGPTLALNNV